MSEDQNKGPIYGVPLPEELAIRNGWTQAVPRRDELKLIRKNLATVLSEPWRLHWRR